MFFGQLFICEKLLFFFFFEINLFILNNPNHSFMNFYFKTFVWWQQYNNFYFKNKAKNILFDY